jgi:hypothetical protein
MIVELAVLGGVIVFAVVVAHEYPILRAKVVAFFSAEEAKIVAEIETGVATGIASAEGEVKKVL